MSQAKGAHYIQLLDAARCHGDWDAVPELVRKIRKHAPARICLTLTAETEHGVIQYLRAHPSEHRPATAEPPESHSLSKFVPPLLEAISNERQHVEDEFQAQVCLGWIHWHTGEHALVASRLPSSIEAEFSQLDGTNKESSEWTKVCALKASYIKGDSQRKTGQLAEALETFESALPILSSVSSPSPGGPSAMGKELVSWTELFLTGFCVLSSHIIKSKVSNLLETETLSAFRAWAKFWEWAPVITGGRAPYAEVTRREVWREYYITLSDLLQQHLPFPTTALTTAYAEVSTRLQQRAELKRVEERYETLLLSEVSFPKADEASEEVESFVEVVMQNWRIMCGSTWHDQDLGEGGAEGVSRGVLDILYRAATKTFHSTAILRHLFTVHLAVAEFDLAFKAFDTYLEIVKRGKARVEKTGEPEHGLDDDDTVLRAASECIKALCRYGSRQGVEKARDICQFFEGWLDTHHPQGHEHKNGKVIENGTSENLGHFITPETFASAWRSIGIGHAQWARLTYDAAARSDIQSRALKCFRKSLLPQFESTTNVETLFALGILLAERRELDAAIQVVRVGLTPHLSTLSNGFGPHVTKYARERSLIPLWHLMALLLSAKQEFPMAVKSCEGVFEQFEDPKNLFGVSELDGTFRSEHLNSNEKLTQTNHGLVDEMDDCEKENILEVKITQLSLLEVLEGPEVAVNASDELLSLFGRLFGDPSKGIAPKEAPSATLVPPKSSAGTLRSMKGSIFGSLNRSKRQDASSTPSERTLAPPRPDSTYTMVSRAPTIQVTNENGAGQRHRRPGSAGHSGHHEKLHKKNSVKTGEARHRSASAGRTRNRSGTATQDSAPTTVDGDKFFTPPAEGQSREQYIQNNEAKPLPPATQNMQHKEPVLQAAHPDPAVAQDHRLPLSPLSALTNPTTRFSKDQKRRRRVTLLVKVWLLIAGFYRRAVMYDDAKGAVEEAHKLVNALEADVLNDPTGTAVFENPGWGGGKSVAELWGDVHAERGSIFVDQSSPYLAMESFESALTYFPNHPAAIVGLSDILLDVYTEDLLPPPTIPALVLPASSMSTRSASTLNAISPQSQPSHSNKPPTEPLTGPLGLAFTTETRPKSSSSESGEGKTTTAFLDRLAARDRAYGLLSALTKLGEGWNNSEAWYTLARAYELGDQKEKAREVLWWRVALEEGRGVRGWDVVGGGGYVL